MNAAIDPNGVSLLIVVSVADFNQLYGSFLCGIADVNQLNSVGVMEGQTVQKGVNSVDPLISVPIEFMRTSTYFTTKMLLYKKEIKD